MTSIKKRLHSKARSDELIKKLEEKFRQNHPDLYAESKTLKNNEFFKTNFKLKSKRMDKFFGLLSNIQVKK